MKIQDSLSEEKWSDCTSLTETQRVIVAKFEICCFSAKLNSISMEVIFQKKTQEFVTENFSVQILFIG